MSDPRKRKTENINNFEFTYEEYLEAIGKAVAQIRKGSNLTQVELGDRIQKGQSSVAKVENGPTPNVALRVLFEIAAAFPIPLSRVFQIAEANLSYGMQKGSQDSWQLAVAEMKKLDPVKQEWLGEIILNILKGSTH